MGGAPETSFTSAVQPQSLGEGVFSSLAPWNETDSGEESTVSPDRVPGDLRFPELTAYRDLVAGAASRKSREPEELAESTNDPAAWEPVPDSPVLKQIVQQHAAAGGAAAAIAEIIQQVAERVRRGELPLPGTAADGEAAALAMALAAILQPGRR